MKGDLEEASKTRARLASTEGYLSLAILAFFVVIFPQVDHPSNVEVGINAVIVGGTFGLALGGVRFGRGGGRIAAWVVLGLLSSWLALVLLVSLTHLDQVIRYWRR